MPTIEQTIRIEAPPDAVADVLINAEKAPRWVTGLQRFEVVAGTPGVPGCVAHAHYGKGRHHKVLVDTLEFVAPQRFFRSHVSGPGIEMEVETTLEPILRGGTDVRLVWIERGTTWFTRISINLTRRRIAARARANLESLKELVEAAAPGPPGPSDVIERTDRHTGAETPSSLSQSQLRIVETARGDRFKTRRLPPR